MLTLGMTLSLMSPLASYAKMGTETSGGGDAVIVNNEIMIRDLLDQEQVKKVEDDLKFLNETPGFRKLIHTLAKVNPAFAYSVLEDLLHTQKYLSPSELQLLPYGQTTVSGKPADIQLAIRTEDDIVFAPSFFKSQQEYVLLHESLHGILSNNSGPMHHLRVRNIVKYINENINNLDAKELKAVLANNNYYRAVDVEGDSRRAYSWDEKLDENLRCFFIANDGGQEIEKFENLNCLKYEYDNAQISASQNLQAFMKKKFPEYAGEALEDWREIKTAPYYSEDLVLKKDSLFDGNQKRWQKMLCRNNDSTFDDLNEYKKEWSSKLDSIKKINLVLSNATLGNAERTAFLYAQGLRSYSVNIDPISYQAEVEQNLIKTELGIKTVLKQKSACDKQYPKNY
jgi:hypothetical protein